MNSFMPHKRSPVPCIWVPKKVRKKISNLTVSTNPIKRVVGKTLQTVTVTDNKKGDLDDVRQW